MTHAIHVVCGPSGPFREFLIPQQSGAFLYFNATTRTDYTGDPLSENLFYQRLCAIGEQAHFERGNQMIPQDTTIVIDCADKFSRLPSFLAGISTKWCRISVWLIFDEYKNISRRVIRDAECYYMFRRTDVRSVLDKIPVSNRNINISNDLFSISHSLQWWKITRWRRSRRAEGTLGWINVKCVDFFPAMKRCMRRFVWRRWIRELIVIGRFVKRLKPRALFLQHKAYAPGGCHYLRALKEWNDHLSF